MLKPFFFFSPFAADAFLMVVVPVLSLSHLGDFFLRGVLGSSSRRTLCSPLCLAGAEAKGKG